MNIYNLMKNIALLFILAISFTACYNYDGPTRTKTTTTGTNLTSNSNSKTSTKPRELKDIKPLNSKDYLMTIAEDIKRTLPSAQVTLLQDSLKVLFPDNIKYGPSGIMPLKDFNKEIKKLAGLINKYDKTNVLITGHTDKNGDEKTNKRISSLRADYIRDLLLAYKAPKDRINSWGLGSSSPVSSEKVNGGAENNRRVEFVILSTIQDEEEF